MRVRIERHMKNLLITSSVGLQRFKAVEVIFVLLLAKNHRVNILKRTISMVFISETSGSDLLQMIGVKFYADVKRLLERINKWGKQCVWYKQ